MSVAQFEDLSAAAAIFELTGRRILYASNAALLRLKENSPREKDKLDASRAPPCCWRIARLKNGKTPAKSERGRPNS